ncbi:MAG: dicarboxylate/amino acid:cation symporter [Rhodothermales bacterium]|nr:dicarboxylate/amino acid:cation symporter [Rhodothermales bacterium]
MPWYRKLHWQIIIGLVLGLIYGVIAAANGWVEFTDNWITPFGTVFINLLKLIAIPLIIASLITGVASLSDLKKLSRIGGKTIGLYLCTTLVALIIGLVVVNVLKPGNAVPPEMRQELEQTYQGDMESRIGIADEARDRVALQPLIDIVPDNLFSSISDNRNMLQVVFFSIFVGIGLILMPREKAQPLITFFDSANDLVIRLVEIIMFMAPIGVFGLLAGTISSIAGDDPSQIVELIGALGYYCLAVIIGLFLHAAITYPTLLKTLTPVKLSTFMKGMSAAQLVAFSTSSSGATLPVTMESVEKNIGVSEEVSSFVLPLGATINMDGTGLYQAIAAVFIAQALGMDLSLTAQVVIVLTAMLASIGTAAVPSAGIVMLVIILEAINVPSEGIALILGVDRILDMLRTVVNVTGDATVATVVAASEGQLDIPELAAVPQTA